MTVFLDVGAHRGMTVAAALDYGFERVYAFEPMPREFAQLQALYGHDPRVTLLNFGLSNQTADIPVYGSNDRFEASIYRTSAVADDAPETICQFVDASDWFREHLSADTPVVAKVNCEGSEVDIFQSLVASGEVWKLAAVLIAFEIQLVAGQEHRVDEVRDSFERIGFTRWHIMAAYKGANCIRDWLDDIKVAA